MWAFGAVLYEMLTGKRAFDGEDMSDTMAAVLKSDPDWALLPPEVPTAVRTLIQRCLTKDRRQRVADISAAKFILSELGSISERASDDRTPPVVMPRSRWQHAVASRSGRGTDGHRYRRWGVGLAPDVQRRPSSRGSCSLWQKGNCLPVPDGSIVTVSPDGTKCGLRREQPTLSPGRLAIWSRSRFRAATATGRVLNPIFAPDGQSIAFFAQGPADSPLLTSLKRIPITGGTATDDGRIGVPYRRELG